MSGFDLHAWTAEQLQLVEQALEQWVPNDAPADLGPAMRYAVLDGGKRLRPLLVLASLQACTQRPAAWMNEAGMRAACAIELIHAYSLVHDDMPCMDNDVLRRGKPTVHVKYGEAGALLAGDALQTLAFELLTPSDSDIPAQVQAGLCGLLARGAGHAGMAGGQAIDLASVGDQLTLEQLQRMHRCKTGALLETSVVMGAVAAQANADTTQALLSYGQALGVAFQVVDDILDVTADTAVLGKTAGKDADNDKPTYVSLLGLQGAQQEAARLAVQAQQALAHSGLTDTRVLQSLANWVLQRKH
jgi:farnesyl diphosphate synthase